jgi:hypothetical protein
MSLRGGTTKQSRRMLSSHALATRLPRYRRNDIFLYSLHVIQQLSNNQTIVKSRLRFLIPFLNRIFAPNLEAAFYAKNKKYSDHRTR